MALAKQRLLACFVGASLSSPSYADLRVEVKETHAGVSSTRQEYFKGARRRRDFGEGRGYIIVDLADNRSIFADPAKREYQIRTLPVAQQAADASRTVVLEIETRDTGERRQMFGRTAQHLITTERRQTGDIVTDGWYADFPRPFPNHSRVGTVYTLMGRSGRQGRPNGPPKVQVTRHGPAPFGAALWEMRGDELIAVTAISEEPLDDKLFEPPPEFRRVIHPSPGERLSWSDQLLFGWQEFQDWLASL